MIFGIYAVYNKYKMIKIGNQTEKNRKCSNNFAAICTFPAVIDPLHVTSLLHLKLQLAPKLRD